MADNYLEQRMEDLRSGRIARENSEAARKAGHKAIKPTRTGVKTHRWSLLYPELRVIVTGGANGIGRGVVEAFRAINCKVAFCDVESKSGSQLAQKTGARFYPVDVRDAEALERMLDDVAGCWGDIDVVVNNVGIGRFCPLAETTLDDWRNVADTNLRPVFLTGRFMARLRMRTGKTGGAIVNISSTRHIQSEKGTVCYSASKGGVVSATHALMMSLSEFGITVNCISPGWINVAGDALSDEDLLQHPSRRVGTAADIASLVLYLVHPDHNFINGADIPVDGGMTHKMIYVE